MQFSTYIDRSNLSFAAFQFKADIHISNTIYGLGASIFFVGYTISQVCLILYTYTTRKQVCRE